MEMNKTAVLYIHGKGGNAGEADHYRALFTEMDVIGFDYKSETPWDFCIECKAWLEELSGTYSRMILVANSIGAYFTMNACGDFPIDHAFFISPVVDMEKLILNMMHWAGVSEKELMEKQVIHTAFGEDLSWDYLSFVRTHPINWNVKTDILYGERDNLTDPETMECFAKKTHASLSIMKDGEHWFHTEEQMAFLDQWIIERKRINKV